MLALLQHTLIAGFSIGQDNMGGEHKFSAFVDDSTIFLQKAGQVDDAMVVVRHFGRLAGLQVQEQILFLAAPPNLPD